MPVAEVRELALRRALGVPDDAKRVLVLQESSHWDTNWLKTSEEYFQGHIQPIFDAVFEQLAKEPTRVFAVESVFFLKKYWETHRTRRAELEAHLASRRLRLLGASLTTPDTLLPHPESVLRDYLLGQQWLRAIGCDVFPRVAYFPDNFGHAPTLPSLMRAVGVDSVGVTRIDGMHFVGSDWRLPGAFPLPGSTAHTLQREHQTLDFVWKDAAGAEVLCHWNAFTYFQGDMLAHKGIIRWSGKLFGVPWRTERHIARQLDGFVRALEPVSKTPYLFCPIGLDFNPPIDGLVSLLARYNRERSPLTGTHVVLAGLDDYLQLVDCHREKLPRLEVDPNPAWMGFYASRPELKTRHTRAARRLLELEREESRDTTARNELDVAWELVTLSNHHDFITGTSPDRVVDEEQLPWLRRAEALLRRAAVPVDSARPPPRWALRGRQLHVVTAHYSLILDEEKGGAITQLRDARGEDLLSGVGFDLVSYEDTGGLWRLGHEYAGGTFRRRERASDRSAELSVKVEGDALRIDVRCYLAQERFRRTLWCRDAEAGLQLRLEGLPAARTTVTCLFELTNPVQSLRMDTAGGFVTRPREKLYAPTFWPALSHVEAGPLRLSLDAPTGVSAGTGCGLEWIVARHATKERAFGVLPVLAHPVGGTVTQAQTHDVTVSFGAKAPAERGWVSCSDQRVRIGAVKKAADQRGLIIRLHADLAVEEPIELRLDGLDVLGAHLCDARETDLEAVEVSEGGARVRLSGAITTVRLATREKPPGL